MGMVQKETKMQSIENRIKKIINNIIKDENVKVILYGSRARGDYNERSDFDIALAGKEKLEEKIIRIVKEEFEESTIPYKVEVVDFNNVSDVLKKQINAEGVVWNSPI